MFRSPSDHPHGILHETSIYKTQMGYHMDQNFSPKSCGYDKIRSRRA